MKTRLEFPYIKVYIDNKNQVRYMVHKNQSVKAMLTQESVGNLLIDFALLDLSGYKKRTDTLTKGITDDFSAEDAACFSIFSAEVYEIAKLLNDPHTIACMYLLGKLDTVFSADISDTEKITTAVKVLEEVLILQEIFSDGLAMCCDVDFENEGISQSGLFLAFTGKYLDFLGYHLMTGTAIAPTKDGKIDFEMIDKVNSDNITDHKEQLTLIDDVKDNRAKIVTYTALCDFADLLYFEFTELLKQGLQIRKCKLCGKYFVLRSRHRTLFCDRSYAGKRTCKQVGNKLEYDRKVASDPLLQEYERIYKLHHAQLDRDAQKESPAEFGRAKNVFLKWSKQAQKRRKSYLSGKIDAREFQSWMEQL